MERQLVEDTEIESHGLDLGFTLHTVTTGDRKYQHTIQNSSQTQEMPDVMRPGDIIQTIMQKIGDSKETPINFTNDIIEDVTSATHKEVLAFFKKHSRKEEKIQMIILRIENQERTSGLIHWSFGVRFTAGSSHFHVLLRYWRYLTTLENRDWPEDIFLLNKAPVSVRGIMKAYERVPINHHVVPPCFTGTCEQETELVIFHSNRDGYLFMCAIRQPGTNNYLTIHTENGGNVHLTFEPHDWDPDQSLPAYENPPPKHIAFSFSVCHTSGMSDKLQLKSVAIEEGGSRINLKVLAETDKRDKVRYIYAVATREDVAANRHLFRFISEQKHAARRSLMN